MKKTLLYLIIFHFTCFSQETKIPESILCSPVLLLTNSEQGSGVFISDSNYIFFLTARHNLFSLDTSKKDTSYKLIPKSGQFIFYPHNFVTDDPAIMDIDLKGAMNNDFIQYDKKN